MSVQKNTRYMHVLSKIPFGLLPMASWKTVMFQLIAQAIYQKKNIPIKKKQKNKFEKH